MELVSADIALVVVCLLVAAQPRQARPAAPIVATFVAALVVGDVSDLLRGATLAAQEWHHLAEVLAAAAVVMLARLSTEKPRAALGRTGSASDPG